MPTKEEADLLQIPVTLPVLEIVRVGRSAQGRAARSRSRCMSSRSDRVEQVVVLERDESANWPWPDSRDERALARKQPRPPRRASPARRHGLTGLLTSTTITLTLSGPPASSARATSWRTAAAGSAAAARTSRIAEWPRPGSGRPSRAGSGLPGGARGGQDRANDPGGRRDSATAPAPGRPHWRRGCPSRGPR